MELSSEPLLPPRDMAQVPGDDGDDGRVPSGGDYESLPENVSVLTHMAAGAVAGVLEHSVMYPVDSVKTRMQSLQPDANARYRSVWEALKRMTRTEGILTPLRGLKVTMLGAGPAHALYFACYERTKRWLSHGSNSHIANGVAGGVATVVHDAVMNPAEVVKQRMQIYRSPYSGLWECVLSVCRTEGASAFYRSYGTQLLLNVPFQSVHFVVYELLQERLNPRRRYHPRSHVVAGAAAGAAAAAITTPLDVCKTLLNTQEGVAPGSAHGRLRGVADAVRTVYRLGGVAAFFKGTQARVIYQTPSTAIAWSVYEFFKYFLSRQEVAPER